MLKPFRITTAFCLGVFVLFHAAVADAQNDNAEIAVLSDLSGSNPLLSNKQFNERAKRYVLNELENLKKGTVVRLHYFGSLQATANFDDDIYEVKRHNLKAIKHNIGKAISELPTRMSPQGSTNILALFSRSQFSCGNGNQIIVLTDGIEASEYISPDKLLSGEQSLPKPNEFVSLKGCKVTFFGLGVGRSDKEATTLRRQWRDWFAAAGAEFKAVLL
ncbi:hypothetical protein AltI4_18780 [Alteromonas sp. I4]|nr:hypothetical protein AltI4_18780 [Alteromonas sp. I4]